MEEESTSFMGWSVNHDREIESDVICIVISYLDCI